MNFPCDGKWRLGLNEVAILDISLAFIRDIYTAWICLMYGLYLAYEPSFLCSIPLFC